MQNDSNQKQILWVSDLPMICKSKTLFDRLRLRLRLRLRPSLLLLQKTNQKKSCDFLYNEMSFLGFWSAAICCYAV